MKDRVWRDKIIFLVILLLLAMSSINSAVAAGVKAVHGGQLQKGSSNHYYEMTLREVDPALHTQEMVLYVYDMQGRPQVVRQVTARAVIIIGREKVNMDLPSVGGNRLVGSALFMPQAGMRVLVTVSWSDDQFPEQVKFGT
ncbi:MAG: hypothetical protein HQL58_13950 [Magnetococcales bacterium]|nr:hypothetical protein [Magnetococcales bacterium]